MLQKLNELIQSHGNDTEDQDRSDDHIQLKYLSSIDDQISEPLPGSQEFPYDHTYEREAYIDLHIA